MRISKIFIQNFRKLHRCVIELGEQKTLFVGANNSGKTSAMTALSKFLVKEDSFKFNDFTVSHRAAINAIGKVWQKDDSQQPETIEEFLKILPSLDVWLHVEEQDIRHVADIIPTLDWNGGILGVRLLFQPKDIAAMYSEYKEAHNEARKKEKSEYQVSLFPKDLCEFLDKNLSSLFEIKAYLLDPKQDYNQEVDLSMLCSNKNPLKSIVQVDMIDAQRGFSDPDSKQEKEWTSLSVQMRNYYSKHLDPEVETTDGDLAILDAMIKAQRAIDSSLKTKFKDPLSELEGLGYPGVTDPKITICSKISSMDAINHETAIQYSLDKENQDLTLPEKYNGLGYQNLVSMVFKLMSFRDNWLKVNKNDKIKPLHLVLVEEPEAHLHAQVQQVFVRRAYDVLRHHELLGHNTSFSTQLVVSTHSSYIAKEEDFSNLRYFKRLPASPNCTIPNSIVINLTDTFGTGDATKKFATRYIKTTHCDLFFADALIMIEGTSEGILLPHFISREQYHYLNSRYISILNVGGRYSHKLRELINKLSIPTLIITDIDSQESTGYHKKAVPERNKGLICGNTAIPEWLSKENDFDSILDLPSDDKILEIPKDKDVTSDFKIRICYQTPIVIEINCRSQEAIPRTFEDAFVYTNLDTLKDVDETDQLISAKLFSAIKNFDKEHQSYEELRKDIFEKLDDSGVKAGFALDLLFSFDPNDFQVPEYIADGLQWLQNELTRIAKDE